MILKETAAVPAGVLPVAELSEHLRLGQGFADDGAEDPLLERLLRDAVAAIEQRLALSLIRRGYELTLSVWDRNGHVTLPTGPVDALDSFEIVTGSGAKALEPSDWRLEPRRSRQKVTGPVGCPLPTLHENQTARMMFQAGFGPNWHDIPPDLRRAVILMAAHGYENRDGSGDAGIPAGVMALLDLHRPVRL